MKFLALSGLLGGNVRAGFEDNLFFTGRGKPALVNADQGRRIRRIAEELAYHRPDEAPPAHALMASDSVAF